MKKSVLSMLLALVMVLGFALMTAPEARAAETIELLYDDRKELSEVIGVEATTVEITNQEVTSRKIGTETADDNVLIYEDGKIIAVGTGTATIVADGTSYDVTVTAAPISMFLITGHSVGAGQEGNGAQSVEVEAGQVYSSFQRVSMPNAEGGLGYGSATRAGGTGTGALDAFAPGQGGTRGVASALGYRWNQLTGEKVWIMNLAIPGSCINEWLPGVAGWHYEKYKDDPAKEPTYLANYAYKYESVVERFGYAQTVMQNEIAAGHYTLSHMAMFYFSGANFGNANYNDWTYESLKSDYETFWYGLKEDMARDMDGDGDTETFESLGIVPLWTASNTDYRQDKALNYIMAASADYPDVYIASDVYRDWMTAEGLASFPAIDYTTQSTAVTVPTSVSYSADTPNSVFCSSDNTHLSQVTYNAVGLDMAQTYNKVCRGEDTVSAIDLKQVNGAAMGESITLTVGVPSAPIVPALSPEYASNITVTCSEGLELVWPMSVKGSAAGTGTVTFSAGNVTETLSVEVVEHQDHCACGGHGVGLGDHTCATVQYQPWGTTDAEKKSLPKSGNYYLVSDISLTASTTPTGDVNLCLNGHNITATGNSSRIYYPGAVTLSITDCGAEEDWGTISNGYSSWYGGMFYMNTSSTSKGTLNLYAGNFDASGNSVIWGGVVLTSAGSTLNIYKANLTGGLAARRYVNTSQGTRDGRGAAIYMINGTANIYGGTITGGQAQNSGGNIFVGNGTMNIYGGTISGGKVDGSLGTLTDGNAASGGNISVEKGTVNISGGTITGGTSTKQGGNISIIGAGTLNITGGTVTSGTSTSNGGNIALLLSGAKVNISGGLVTAGVASGHGGNIHQISGTTLTITGGTVSDGTAVAAASKQGGNINSGTGTLVVSGGTVTGGKASGYGGNICGTPGGKITVSGKAVISNGKTGAVSSGGTDGTVGTGGNIFAGNNDTSPCSVTVTGGTISGGFAKQGGNIYVDGEAVISGGTIKDGKTITTGSAYAGGNISVTTRGKLEISGGTISGGESYNGGSIYVAGSATKQGQLTMTGGTVTGGSVKAADACGGNIFMAGVMTMSGGTITKGRCHNFNNSCGGNIYLSPTVSGTEILSSVTMTDGIISDGICNNGGGGNVQCHGLFYMYGGTITGGNAKNGGNVRVYRPGHFILDGGEVLAGKIEYIGDSNGGNSFMVEGNDATASAGTHEATLTIKSGTVVGGTNTKTVNGGAIFIANRGIVNIEGGTITGGRANNFVYNGTARIGTGGTIYIYNAGKGTATLNISGGTIEGGLAETYGGLLGIRPCTGKIDINISGGTLIGGEAMYGGLMYLTSGADVDITGGTLVTGTASQAVGGIYVENADVTVTGDAAINGEGAGIYVNNTGASKLTFGDISDIIVVDAQDKTAAFATSETDVTAKLPSADEGYAIEWNEGALRFTESSGSFVAAVCDANGEIARYTSLDQAITAVMDTDMYLKLLTDCTSSREITGKLWLDLNGFDLSGITVSGALYGMDSTTNDYTDANVGTLTATGNIATNCKTSTALYGSVKRYLAIPGENGTYTFHRFFVGVSKISLKPSVVGAGYKATFAGSDTVKNYLSENQAFGYNLWLNKDNVVTRSLASEYFVSLQDRTLRLQNILSEAAENNAERAEMKIYANAFIRLSTGEVIESSTVSYSFREIVEAAALNYETYNETQQAALNALNDRFADVMFGWDIPGMHHSAQSGWTAVDAAGFKALIQSNIINGTHKVYLTEDVNLSSGNIRINGDTDLTVCLNGHSLHSTGNWRVNGTWTICDCCDATANPGRITTNYTAHGQIMYTYRGSVINLYGGELEGTKTVAGGGVICLGGDANDYSTRTHGTILNMYGGKIYGGNVTGDGGNISAFHGGAINIYGGEIYGGTATKNGGNIAVSRGANDPEFVTNIYGGKIYGGSAGISGGNLRIVSDTDLNICGGEIYGGIAAANGGNLYAEAPDVTVSGGTIAEGTATNGGNIYATSTNLAITGGTIRDGKAVGTVQMANVYDCGGFGGNIYATRNLNISGGTITGGEAFYGGNLLLRPGSASYVQNLENVTISGGYAEFDGGNVALLNKGTVNMNGVTLIGGVAGSDGGNLHLFRDMAEANTSLNFPTLNLTDSTLTGGQAGDKGSGLYVQEGILTISGNTNITGNEGSNLYLDAGQTVELENLSETATIGVSMNIAGRITDDTAYAGNLTSDDETLTVGEADGMLWLQGGLKATAPALTGYSVGWYRGDITPTEPVPLDGMGSEFTRSQQWEIVDELEAGFTVIADQTGIENAIVLVSVDTLFIQKELSGNLSAAISDVTGIPANRIFFSANHSHSAVNHDSYYEPTREYLENFYRIMTEYAVLAVEDLKPATIQTASIDIVSEDGVSLNMSRRYIGDDGNAYSSVDSASYPAPSGALRESGSDESLQLIRFVREGGDDVILTNYGSHPSSYNTTTSKAYVDATHVKIFREKVQELMPGTVCTFFLGAAGDVGFNPATTLKTFAAVDGNTYDASNWTGKGNLMAIYAVEALKNVRTVQTGELKVANVTVECGDLYIKSDYKNIDLDLNVVTIGGGIAFVTSPYEMYHENGEQIKAYAKDLGFDTCFVLTNSMGENKYIGSYNAFENDYTDDKLTSFGLRTGRFDQGMGEMLIDQMAKQLAALAGVELPTTVYTDYQVVVVDTDGNAVQNVMLQMMDGSDARNCTKADGTVSYRLYGGMDHAVQIVKLPAGYSVEDMSTQYTLTEGQTLTITVQKAG